MSGLLAFMSILDPDLLRRQWERDEKWRRRLPWLFGKPAKSSAARIVKDRLRAVIAEDRAQYPALGWVPQTERDPIDSLRYGRLRRKKMARTGAAFALGRAGGRMLPVYRWERVR